MDVEEKEYEVESIIQARVISEGKRGKKNLVWKYRVRWKGYGADDDTWEPAESFEGSEDIIDTFWGRANTGGRDYHNIRTFKIGEEFLPVGPPRRKRKVLKPDVDDSPEAESSKHGGPENEKRKRGTPASDGSEGRPNKRAREHGPVPTLKLSPPPQNVPTQISLPGRSNNRASHLNVTETGISTPAHSRQKQRKSIRASSIDEIVPASDGEADDAGIGVSRTNNAGGETIARSGSGSRFNKVAGPSSQVTNPIIRGGGDMPNTEDADPREDTMDDGEHINIPSHRARAANPLVKMAEPPSIPDVDKAIPVKARLFKGNITLSPSASGMPQPRLGRSTQASGSKPGPGRSSTGFVPKKTPKNKSSILTAEKGTLKSVKGKYSKQTELRSAKPEVQEDSVEEDSSLWGDVETKAGVSHSYPQVPTAEELLDLAGLNVQNAEALPDFEDDLPSTSNTNQPTSQLATIRTTELEQSSRLAIEPDLLPQSQTDQVKTALQQSLDLAKDKLFPSGASDVLSSLSAVWKRSTIFGPLGLGSEAQLKPSSSSLESAQSAPFFLNLDSSISIPITLTATSPSPVNLGMGQGGPSGKFYQPRPALSLLDTLRTSGSSAKIVVDANATNEQQDHFQRFHSRLQSGDLFVAMAGVEVFAFCSAGNSLIRQRLNLPSSLLGRPDDLLVSRVIIENYSAYADAALHADSRRWSQYISTV